MDESEDDIEQLERRLEQCRRLSNNNGCDKITQGKIDLMILDLQEKLRNWRATSRTQ
jgi:hypothetical protein